MVFNRRVEWKMDWDYDLLAVKYFFASLFVVLLFFFIDQSVFRS